MSRTFRAPRPKRIKPDTDWPVPDDRTVHFIRSLHAQNDCIAMILAGRSNQEIYKFISDKYGLSIERAQALKQEAEHQIIKRKDWEIGAVINLHLNRYEEMYGALVEMGATNTATLALKAKERLLQFHKQGTHIKVANNHITHITVGDQKGGYDIDKLDPQNKQRLMELLQKTQ